MAKGKGGSGKQYVSKGERKSSAKTPNTDGGIRLLNQINALRKGKNVVWSLPNVGKDNKVHASTRVKVNGKDYITAMKHALKGQKEVEV